MLMLRFDQSVKIQGLILKIVLQRGSELTLLVKLMEKIIAVSSCLEGIVALGVVR